MKSGIAHLRKQFKKGLLTLTRPTRADEGIRQYWADKLIFALEYAPYDYESKRAVLWQVYEEACAVRGKHPDLAAFNSTFQTYYLTKEN